MFKQKVKFFKKYKLSQLQKIKQTHKYIYIFRYIDLTINEIILLKKNIKKLKYKSLILKQKLTIQTFQKLKGQGPVLIIYGDNDLHLIGKLPNLKKLKLVYLCVQNNIYSGSKLNRILSDNNPPLNSLVVLPFLNFIYYLRKI